MLAVCFAGWLAGWLACWLDGCLFCWLACWLAGMLAGWLRDWGYRSDRTRSTPRGVGGFRRSFFESILELCRTHRKMRYVLPEMNPKLLQMKKCFFRNNWGWHQTLEVKGRLLVVKIKFLRKLWKKDDHCTSIFHFADRPEVPYEVHFWRNRFAQNIGVQKSWRFLTFSEGGFGCFRRDFGLEPWRQILRRGRLSFLSNQIS